MRQEASGKSQKQDISDIKSHCSNMKEEKRHPVSRMELWTSQRKYPLQSRRFEWPVFCIFIHYGKRKNEAHSVRGKFNHS